MYYRYILVSKEGRVQYRKREMKQERRWWAGGECYLKSVAALEMGRFPGGLANLHVGGFAGVVIVFDVGGFVGLLLVVVAVVLRRFHRARGHGGSRHSATATGHHRGRHTGIVQCDVVHALREGEDGGEGMGSIGDHSGAFLSLDRRSRSARGESIFVP